jgi:hypothetical protein
VFQNSPLIERYLKVFGEGGEHRKLAIQRNNVLKPILSINPITYRQLIEQSMKSSKSRSEVFQKAQEDIVKERNKIQNDITTVLITETEKAKKILKKQSLVKQAADGIIEAHLSKKKGMKLGGMLF